MPRFDTLPQSALYHFLDSIGFHVWHEACFYKDKENIMTKPFKLYLRRDAFGCVQFASFLRASSLDPTPNYPLKHCRVGTTKGLIYAMIQRGTTSNLFDAAWRMALREDAIKPSRKLGVDDGSQTIVWAKDEAVTIENYISQLVNNPKSKFYIYG